MEIDGIVITSPSEGWDLGRKDTDKKADPKLKELMDKESPKRCKLIITPDKSISVSDEGKLIIHGWAEAKKAEEDLARALVPIKENNDPIEKGIKELEAKHEKETDETKKKQLERDIAEKKKRLKEVDAKWTKAAKETADKAVEIKISCKTDATECKKGCSLFVVLNKKTPAGPALEGKTELKLKSFPEEYVKGIIFCKCSQ